MMRRSGLTRPLAAMMLAAALNFAPPPRSAAAQAAPQASPAIPAAPAAPAAPAPYRPGLGDLMTMTVQPRHIKLWLASRDNNWAYLGYELHELIEAFERAAHVWPRWQGLPVAEMFEATIKGPVAELTDIIKQKDAGKFAAGYDKLTAACNACHQVARRDFVVIKTPENSPFSDQDFRPVSR